MALRIQELSVGIIGGRGKMGRFFENVLRGAGCKVILSDIDEAPDHKAVIENCDAILFSVPLADTVDVITRLKTAVREEQILIDLSSLKVSSMQAMIESKAEVLGLHPMFAPDVGTFAGQTVIYIPQRKREKSDLFLSLLRDEKAVLIESKAEEHDRMMAIIQGLTHFSAISTAMALKALNVDVAKSLEFSSPVYRMRMEMVGRILAQAPDLYADIALINPYTVPVLRELQKVSNDLCSIIEKGDRNGFLNCFKASAKHLGDFCPEALQRTSEILRASAKISGNN